jgi:hypothetical protein
MGCTRTCVVGGGVGHHTGRDLYTALDGASSSRPIGLIETNVGGTPDQHWSSPDALAKCKNLPGNPPWEWRVTHASCCHCNSHCQLNSHHYPNRYLHVLIIGPPGYLCVILVAWSSANRPAGAGLRRRTAIYLQALQLYRLGAVERQSGAPSPKHDQRRRLDARRGPSPANTQLHDLGAGV